MLTETVDLDAYRREEWSISADSSVYRLIGPDGEMLFVKEAPDLSAEFERLEWSRGYLPVPDVLEFVQGANDRLVTRAIPGAGAHDRESEPETELVAAVLADALRRIHALPIDECPFVSYTTDDWLDSVATALVPTTQVWDEDLAATRAAGDVLDELIETRPEPHASAVIHGDASTPNFILCNGRLTGIVDVADLGLGDPWCDLATCLASMRRPGNGLAHEQQRFLANYGVAANPARERWHRLLYLLSDASTQR